MGTGWNINDKNKQEKCSKDNKVISFLDYVPEWKFNLIINENLAGLYKPKLLVFFPGIFKTSIAINSKAFH